MPPGADTKPWVIPTAPEEWQDIKKRAVSPVSVAVLDSGIDGSHEKLAGRIAGAAAIILENGKPVVRELSPSANNDVDGHGTAIAGIIASIAPNANIYDLRVLDYQKIGSVKILLAGFRHALTQDWRLLNFSLAVESSVRHELMELCEEAYYHDQIIVASRRNLPIGDEGLPAQFSSCIGVDRGNYERSLDYIFHARNPIEFQAHGEEIVALARGGGYTTVTGTSFATPAVCGLCALLLGAYPNLTMFEVKTALRQLARASKTLDD